MKKNPAAAANDPTIEVVALVRKLHETQQRLQELAGGEVDAVLHPDGQSYLLHEAQERLRESEEKFRQLADNVTEVFWINSPDMQRMHYVSPAYEQIWGRSVDSLYANPNQWGEAILPEERERVYATFSRLAVDEPRVSAEFRIVRPDGTTRWILSRGFQVRDAAGKVVRITGIASDITERKQAEVGLKESERRFREMLENVELIAVTLDKNGTVTFCNDYLLRVTGWKREEVVGADWCAKFLPDASLAKGVFFENIETGEIPPHYENPIKTSTGELREITWNNTVLRDVAGDIAGTASLGEDVTERKQGEDRLREQARLLDLAQDAIMVRDMEDRVEFWNRGAENLYGWTATEVQGKEASSFLYEDESAAAAAARAAVIEHGIWTGECTHTCKDGGTVMVCSRWTLVRDELAAPKSILIINTDITQQKKIEEQFMRAQRLESIGTLASGVAHDLNNILVPILMAGPLLRDDMPASERDKILAIVQSSAERGASIVKQVLTFARGADGHRVLLQPIYLVQEIAKIAEETFPKSVAVRTKYPEDLWTIVANPTQVHQILLNLCINARDAMPTGGTLTLALENFEVDDHYASMTPGAKAGPHVLLEISDTGSGIPPETINKIFDPFFTTKELGQGTGLGLSTAIGIVKSHGGFIEVDSEVGRGTSFKVFLPANMSELGTAQTFEAAPLPPANGELLLIVDDEKFILQVAKAILEDHGYRVLTAADATEALAIFALRMNEIELVLTDLAMPFMDGVALIRTLQKMKPDVRVIASTGRGGQAGHANEIAQLNVRASLIKPYNKNTLLATLRDVLTQAPDNPICEASLARTDAAGRTADEMPTLNGRLAHTQPY
jgi:PAS domain S-box-containing protein